MTFRFYKSSGRDLKTTMCSRLGRLALKSLWRLHCLICSQSLAIGKFTSGLHCVPRLVTLLNTCCPKQENASIHNGTWKYTIAWASLEVIQKQQPLQDTVVLFPMDSGRNWFLNAISCPLRNAFIVTNWTVSSRFYTDVWNPSNLHRNYSAKELWSTWLTVPRSSLQFRVLNLRSAHLRASSAAVTASNYSLSCAQTVPETDPDRA